MTHRCSSLHSQRRASWVRELRSILKTARTVVGATASFSVSSGCAPASSGEGDMSPTLANVQAHVFASACTNTHCHDSTMAGGLELSSAELSFQALVGQSAQNQVAKENRWMLVKPGDPKLSFLYRKLTQPGLGEGAPMPIGDQMLTPPYLRMLEDWILRGALP